jgi:hypothetical protein
LGKNDSTNKFLITGGFSVRMAGGGIGVVEESKSDKMVTGSSEE